MSYRTMEQGVLFKGLAKRVVVAKFDQDHASSDGGALLLKACDQQLGLSGKLAACVNDDRQPSKVQHSLAEMFRQRMFGLACGYEDANDAARLGDDPIHKLLVDRDPIDGQRLASQPTLSRFENQVSARELLRMAQALAETVIARHKRRKKRVKRITIDLDPTEDRTHGAQQLSLFNAFYDTACYLPMAGFLSFDEEPEQYLFCYVLRAGNATAKQGCLSILRLLLPRLRRAFPRARIRIRLDAGFTGAAMYTFFETNKLEYVVCMATNSVLKTLAAPLLDELRDAAPGVRYAAANYQAGAWQRARRVIIKATITYHPDRAPKDNPRFIVTNLKGSPKRIYEQVYCRRGDAENRIKELKGGLQVDRTSCHRFLANQFRALMTSAAYVLMQELRLRARGTSCGKAQVATLRLRLIKIGAWVESSSRRIVIHLPVSMPYMYEWRRIAKAIGAIPT